MQSVLDEESRGGGKNFFTNFSGVGGLKDMNLKKYADIILELSFRLNALWVTVNCLLNQTVKHYVIRCCQCIKQNDKSFIFFLSG